VVVITPGYIEEANDELDEEERLRNEEYPYYGVTDEEYDKMEEMCDPYKDL